MAPRRRRSISPAVVKRDRSSSQVRRSSPRRTGHLLQHTESTTTVRHSSIVAAAHAPDSPPTTRHSTSTSSLPFSFYIAIFVDLFSVATVVPFLGDHAALLNLPYSVVGVVQAIYGAMQLISTPVLGTMCDVWGARRLLLLSIVGTCVAYATLSIALVYGSVLGFIASRVIVGAVRQTMVVGSALVVQSTRAAVSDADGGHLEKVAVSHAMAKFQAAASLGFVVGPTVGGVVQDAFGAPATALVAAGSEAINTALLLYATTAVPSPKRHDDTIDSTTRRRRNPLKLFIQLVRPCNGPSALLASLYLASLASIMIQSTLPLLVRRCFGATGGTVGLLVSLSSGTSVLTMGYLYPSLRRLKMFAVTLDRTMVGATGCMSVVGYSLIALSTAWTWSCQVEDDHVVALSWMGFLAGLGLISVANGVADTIKRAKFALSFPKDMTGEVLSIAFSLDGVNRVVAPLVAGYLVGPRALDEPCSLWMVPTTALIAVVASMASLFFGRFGIH